jgi:hypothetical protein
VQYERTIDLGYAPEDEWVSGAAYLSINPVWNPGLILVKVK